MAKLTGAQRKDLFVFTLSLAECLRSGVSILEGLEVSAAEVSDPGLKTAVHKIKASLTEGSDLASSLKTHGGHYFDRIYVQMVAVGQETGQLDVILWKIAEYLEQDSPMPPVMLFMYQLATMVKAGLPLTQAVAIIGENSDDPGLRETALNMAAAIKGGANFPEAMAKHPKMFSPFIIAMTRAGDQGGNLDVILSRLGDTLGRISAFTLKRA